MVSKTFSTFYALSLLGVAAAFDWKFQGSDCNSFSYTLTLEQREKDAADKFGVFPDINNGELLAISIPNGQFLEKVHTTFADLRPRSDSLYQSDQGILASVSSQFGSDLSVSLQQQFDTPLNGSFSNILMGVALLSSSGGILNYPGSNGNDPDQAAFFVDLSCSTPISTTSGIAPASTASFSASLATSSDAPQEPTSTSTAGPPGSTPTVDVKGLRCAYRDECNSRCFVPGYALALPDSAGYTIGLADPQSGDSYTLTCKGLFGANALISDGTTQSAKSGSDSGCGTGSKSNNYYCQCTYDHYQGACDPSKPGTDTAAKLSPQGGGDDGGHDDSALPVVNNFSITVVMSALLSLLFLYT